MLNDYSAAERKARPVYSGVLKYFPDALLEVANLSRVGNEQHNPGQPLHWAKEKSQDEADALVRHLLDAGTFDTDGVRHSAKVAWRALALLQRELDAEAAARAYLQTQTADKKPLAFQERAPMYYPSNVFGEFVSPVVKLPEVYDHAADNGELPRPPVVPFYEEAEKGWEPNTEGPLAFDAPVRRKADLLF